jgi:uncharacterized phage infection (PIP) family protein YhgE
MTRALWLLPLLALFALPALRTVRADGDTRSEWQEERRAALQAAIQDAETRGDKEAAARFRRELDALPPKDQKAPTDSKAPKDQKAPKDANAPKPPKDQRPADAPKPASVEELQARIAKLQQKAQELRAKGSTEDAEEVEQMAKAWEQVVRLRVNSNEMENQAHSLKANGHDEEAAKALENSGKLWRQSVELEAHLSGGGHHDPMDRATHLHIAANHLRAAGMGDLADRVEREAATAEREAAEKARAAPSSSEAEIQALREQVEVLRKMLEELKKRLP